MPILPQSLNSTDASIYDPKPLPIWQRDISALLKTKYTPKASLRELSVFCRKMSFLLGAGIPIKSALSVVAEQLPGRGLRRLLPGLNAKVSQGESFSAAIKATGAFPGFFCGFVAIGEETAKLPLVMEQLADFYDDQAQTRDELAAALIYPIIVTVMMLGVIVLAVTLVLPGYSRIFDMSGVPLPALTRGLLHMSEFMIANVGLVAGGLVVILFVTAFFVRSRRGRDFVAALQLQVPIVRQSVNFRLTQALCLLLSAGLSVSQAIPLAEDVMDNVRVRRDLGKISARLGAGKPFWEALSEVGYIDPLLVGLARVGEETGKMTLTMEKCQYYYAQTYRRAIRRLNKLVEPVITLVLGVGLGIIVLAVILPTFELATVM